MLQATESRFMFFHTRQVIIPTNGVFFWCKQSSHSDWDEKLMLTNSGLLPTHDVNISHHIMRQVLRAWGCMWQSGRLRTGGGSEEAGASRGGKERGRMTGRAEHTTAIIYRTIMLLSSRFWGAGVANAWGKCEKKIKTNGRWDSKMAGEADAAAICLQCHDAKDSFFFLFFFFHFFFSPCFLATPAWSNIRATPDAGAIAQVHAGVPAAHGRQHRTQIKSTATAP